jgi:hypothetical protein
MYKTIGLLGALALVGCNSPSVPDSTLDPGKADKPSDANLGGIGRRFTDTFSLSTDWGEAADAKVTKEGIAFAAGTACADKVCHWIVRRKASESVSAPWETVDDYFPQAEAKSIALAANGDVYVSGLSGDSALVRKSSDNGKTWSIVSQVSDSGQPIKTVRVQIVGGRIFLTTAPDDYSFNLRTSTDGGVTWSAPSPLQRFDGSFHPPTWVDPSGIVYAAGSPVSDTGGQFNLLSSADFGATWTTQTSDAGHESVVVSLVGDPASGSLYLASWESDGVGHWIVRRSDNQGRSWTIIDDFIDEAGGMSLPGAMLLDPLGRLVVVGSQFGAVGETTTNFTRVQAHPGDAWKTIDSYAKPTQINGAAAYPDGRILTCATGFTVWLVRDSGIE